MEKRVLRLDVILLCVGCVAVYSVSPFAIEGDGIARFEALSRLLADGSFSRTPYSLIGPLASAPLWLLGTATSAPEWWTARFNFVFFVLCLGGLYRALTPEIDRRTTVRFLLLLTLASMFPHHLGRYYSEVFTALAITLGLALVAVKGVYWGWLLAVLGAANSPATLPGLGLVALGWSWRTRDVRHLVPVVVAAAVVLGESWLRRGDPFLTGYEGIRGAQTAMPFSAMPGFSYPFVFGVVSILFSFGKGLLLFAPGLLLVPNQTADPSQASRRHLLVLWSALLLGLVIVYAKWWSWYGGEFWGPRFFLVASIPAALALASWSVSKPRTIGLELAGLACLGWSLWVGLNGLVYRQYGLGVCSADHYALEFLCWYVPEFSVLFRPFVEAKTLSSPQLAVALYFGFVGLYLIGQRLQAVVGSVETRGS